MRSAREYESPDVTSLSRTRTGGRAVERRAKEADDGVGDHAAGRRIHVRERHHHVAAVGELLEPVVDPRTSSAAAMPDHDASSDGTHVRRKAVLLAGVPRQIPL